MSNIRSYRDLEAWQLAMDLADLVYTITDKCVSIPSNIAEGSRHRTPGYISRVIIALGEHAELETQALISQRRKYIDERDMAAFNELSTRVGQVTHGLLRSLQPTSEGQLKTDD